MSLRGKSVRLPLVIVLVVGAFFAGRLFVAKEKVFVPASPRPPPSVDAAQSQQPLSLSSSSSKAEVGEYTIFNPAANVDAWKAAHADLPNVFQAASPGFVFSPCVPDKQMADLQLRLLKDSRAVCDKETGHCKCPEQLIFDGEKCIPRGKQWADTTVSTLQGKWTEIPFVKENYVMSHLDRRGIQPQSFPELASVQWPDANQVRTTFLASLSDKTLVHLWKALASDDTFTMYYTPHPKIRKPQDFES